MKTCGSALGRRILKKVFHGFASRERASSMSSDGVELRPDTMEMTIGKKQIMNTSATFGSAPKPNHTTRSGATATFGTEFNPTSSGYMVRSAIGEPLIA